MDTASPSDCHRLREGGIRRRSNGEILSQTVDVAEAPVVIVTAFAVDSSCHSNSKLSSMATETTNSVATELAVMATTTVNLISRENIYKRHG